MRRLVLNCISKVLVELGYTIPELRQAGFDDASQLRGLGYSAIELKVAAFTAR